jgi:carbonic anhydrase
MVVQTDLNCLSVLQFAVEALRVKHVIVCGHYACGGVLAAMRNQRLGLIDNWLRNVQEVQRHHAYFLADIADETERLNRLCELNVIEQVANVCRTTVVQDAWARGQSVAVHGWIYGISDGLLRDLALCITNPVEFGPLHEEAVARAAAGVWY